MCYHYAALAEAVSPVPILACLPARKGMPGNHIDTGSCNLLRNFRNEKDDQCTDFVQKFELIQTRKYTDTASSSLFNSL